jgi:hypothetical protein
VEKKKHKTEGEYTDFSCSCNPLAHPYVQADEYQTAQIQNQNCAKSPKNYLSFGNSFKGKTPKT